MLMIIPGANTVVDSAVAEVRRFMMPVAISAMLVHRTVRWYVPRDPPAERSSASQYIPVILLCVA